MESPCHRKKNMSLTCQTAPTVDAIDPEERMKIYVNFMTKDSWESVRDELNVRVKDTNLAQLVNDIPQRFRIEILKQLEQNGASIDADWQQLQRERVYNDPDEVFPLVATPWLLQNLHVWMTTCNICGDRYARGEDIIKKACGKHTMHRFCLTVRLNEGGMPLHGPCGCNNGGLDLSSSKPFMAPTQTSMRKTHRRPATPMPTSFQLEGMALSTTSSDPDYRGDSDSASVSGSEASLHSVESASTGSWSSSTTTVTEQIPSP